MELERDQFEEVALAHFVAQRAAGVQISGDNGCEPTRESLFWRDDKGDYGVRMFNAAWWGWKSACEAMTPIATKVPAGWQSIGTAPKDNTRLLYLARFDDEGALIELDYDGIWEYWSESYEMPHINGWTWMSANGIEEPTHWCYQEEHLAPAPSEAAITYMTGYSDGREWAGATNQAGELNDAKRLDWIRDQLFEHKWNGVVGKGCAVQWVVAPDFRFKQRELTDDSGITAGDFRRAIDAAIKAKEPK